MWIFYAIGSSFFAGITAILAKCGIDSFRANGFFQLSHLGILLIILYQLKYDVRILFQQLNVTIDQSSIRILHLP